MSIDDLRSTLISRGVRADAYCLGGDQNESYCLVAEGRNFRVYYAERGAAVGERRHATESAACADLLERLSGDATVRSQ